MKQIKPSVSNREKLLFCILAASAMLWRGPVVAVLSAQSPPTAVPETMREADAAFRAGAAARQSGQLEAARADFAKVVRLAPQIAEGHQALGAVLLELGKPAEAAPEFEAALKLRRNDPGMESGLALALAQSGQSASAIPHFEAAIRLAHQRLDQPGRG